MMGGKMRYVASILLTLILLLFSNSPVSATPYTWEIGMENARAFASPADAISITIKTNIMVCNARDASGQIAYSTGSAVDCPDQGAQGWTWLNVPGGEIYLTTDLDGAYFDHPDGHYVTGSDGLAHATLQSTKYGWAMVKSYRGPNKTNYWADLGPGYFEDCSRPFPPEIYNKCGGAPVIVYPANTSMNNTRQTNTPTTPGRAPQKTTAPATTSKETVVAPASQTSTPQITPQVVSANSTASPPVQATKKIAVAGLSSHPSSKMWHIYAVGSLAAALLMSIFLLRKKLLRVLKFGKSDVK